MYSTAEIRIYRKQLDCFDRTELAVRAINKDAWSDLEAYDQRSTWVDRDLFLATAAARRDAGEHVFTIVESGCLVHYGWIIAQAGRQYIPDVDQTTEFPAGSVYLYDFFTHPAFRNRGLYQHSLRQVLGLLATTSDLREAFIGVRPDNAPSRRVIEKLGFQYCRSLCRTWKWNRIERWSVEAMIDEPRHVA